MRGLRGLQRAEGSAPSASPRGRAISLHFPPSGEDLRPWLWTHVAPASASFRLDSDPDPPASLSEGPGGCTGPTGIMQAAPELSGKLRPPHPLPARGDEVKTGL